MTSNRSTSAGLIPDMREVFDFISTEGGLPKAWYSVPKWGIYLRLADGETPSDPAWESSISGALDCLSR